MIDPWGPGARPPGLDPRHAERSDEELQHLRRQSLTALQATQDADTALKLYQKQLLPLEREAVFRQRASLGRTSLLVITVGTQANTPIAAGLAWQAAHVLLLHTDKTSEHARLTARELGRDLSSDASLIDIGDGTGVSRLYAAIRDAWRGHGQPRDVVVDISGGLKAMSAAAGAAALLMPGATIAYVETSQPYVHGKQFWLDTKVIKLRNPYEDFGELRRSEAQQLVQRGAYAAAADLYQQLAQHTGHRPDEWLVALTDALADADRLDFSAALGKLDPLAGRIARDARNDPRVATHPLAQELFSLWLDARVAGLEAVHSVATPASGGDLTRMQGAAFLDFIAFLLALADRRHHAGEHDLAALFAYRAMEAIPQRRLARLGYDVAAFDWGRLAIQTSKSVPEIADCLQRGGGDVPTLRTALDRGTALEVLARVLQDDLVSRSDLKRLHGVTEARNQSVLAHGLRQITAKASGDLLRETRRLLERLLALEGFDDAQQRSLWARHAPLTTALWLDVR